MNKLVAKIIIGFVMRQVAKYGADFDVEKFEKDLEPRVRDVVPGEWLDDDAVALMKFLVERLKAVLTSTAQIEAILNLVAAQDWDAALAALKSLLLDGWKPEGFKKGPNGLAFSPKKGQTEMSAEGKAYMLLKAA